MARFYGTVKGNRGRATRLGYAGNAGLRTAARSYSGSIIVHMFVRGDEDYVRISVSSDSSDYGDKELYQGPVKQLVNESSRSIWLTALALDVPILQQQ